MGSYGLGSDSGLLERFLANTKRISRLALLTISNTFRRKWRVLLMQVALVMSGLIFMMVVSVRDSVVYTFDEVLFSILNYDINFVLSEAERIEPVETMTRNHPDVTAVEMWGLASGSLRLQGQPESEDDESSLMFGVELPTTLYGYQLRAGRWLEPDDTYAVVLNQELANEAGLRVGDWITFQYGPRQSTDWQIVGLVFDPILTNSAHVPRATLLRETGNVGRAQTVWIQTRFDNVEDHAALATELRTHYAERQFDVSPQRGVFGVSDTATETGQSIINQFSFIVGLLGIMAVIIGAVGSIALSGTLSLSVLERRREIGVMRAIGASSWDILRLFVGEGLLLGWLSWLIALPFSYFAGQVMLNGIGAAFQLDLVYKYTPLGTIMWLVIITILSVLASILPARGAIRVSVRESLAYQ
jgi:putative ABC transport system permease protein